MNQCQICGYPIPPPNTPYGYVGPVCMGHAYQAPVPSSPAPLSGDDVRKIVREELERVHLKPFRYMGPG
jgi:hypothetical protein